MELEQAATADAEPTSRYLELEGLKLHYLDWGGDSRQHTFLLLHGGSAHAHWWDHVAPLLVEQGRVLALDFRGHGGSDWVRPANYGIQIYVEDVRAMIDHLGTRVILGGHSMGGEVAQWFAARHPEKLEALLCVDSPFGGPPLMRRLMWRWRRLKMRRTRGPGRPELKTLDDVRRRFKLSPPDTYLKRHQLERLAHLGAEQLPNGNWAFRVDPETRNWRRMNRQRMRRPDPKAITAPTLILRGDQSGLVSARSSRRMHARIRGSVYREIPRAFHHVPLDNPADTAQAIIEFVDTL
ncbi:MAG TPA: alpha/beta hydrolase [Candidatus Binataceae bacterium]|nr:alpha/beta hydrolase [Candidatus Binataceae bacterium]